MTEVDLKLSYDRFSAAYFEDVSNELSKEALMLHMEKWPIHRRSSCFFFKLNFKHVYNLR